MSASDPLGTLPMFPEPDPPPVAKPSLTSLNGVSGGYGRAAYAKYRPKNPVRCDDCAAAFIANPNAPKSLPAAFKRTQKGAKALLLCHKHTQLRREAEAA